MMLTRVNYTLNGFSFGRKGNLREKLVALASHVSDGTNKSSHHAAPATAAAGAAAVQLPRLPVPPLQQTLQKYLKTVKPLVDEKDYENTENVVKEFGSPSGIGPKLQTLLIHRAETTDNWLSDWWLRSAYMEYRMPVVMYSSPGMVLPSQTFRTKEDQLTFASKVIAAALEYKALIDKNSIPLETMGKKPLDMSQYSKILCTCRIPGETRDSMAYFSAESPKHVVVAHNNHFFKLEVYANDGSVISEDQILRCLKDIVSQSAEKTVPVGILTSQKRDVWGKVYKELMKDEKNLKSVHDIQRSIFLISIDQPNKADGTLNKRTVAARQMIHGDGSESNAGNRWYDKTIQFIVGSDGEVGITYEHSPSEGPPVANLTDYVMDYVLRAPSTKSTSGDVAPPVRLNFNIGSDVNEAVRAASHYIDTELVKDLDMNCFTYKRYGKNFIKAQRLSPDSFIQMAIQLAYYRVHGKPGACYESASTRQFIHGRTETIRSTSVESVQFCKEMLANPASAEKAAEAIRSAVDAHKQYVTDAVNGYGVDRHLLGLKLTAIENGIEAPRFYQDYGYKHSSTFRISTSQVAAKHDSFMCYGPLVNDGYACCYNPRSNEMTFGVSACFTAPETDAAAFRDALEKSLDAMHDVLVRSQKSKL